MRVSHACIPLSEPAERERRVGQGLAHHTPRDYRMALVGGTSWAVAAVQTSRLVDGVTLNALLVLSAALLMVLRRRHRLTVQHRGGRWQATALLLLVVSASVGMVTQNVLARYDAHPVHAMLANTEQARCHLRVTQHPTRGASGDVRALGVIESCSNLSHAFDTPVRVLMTGRSPIAGDHPIPGYPPNKAGGSGKNRLGDLTLADLNLGDTVEATGRLKPSPWASPPIVGQFAIHSVDTRLPPQGLTHYSQELHSHLHALLRGHSPHAQALIPGLVLGDKSTMGSREKQQFRAASFSHLVVVSGFHLGILAATLSVLLPGRGIFSAGVSALGMVGMVIASGASPSTIRAFLMAGAVLAGRLMGHGTQSGAALGAAVTFMILHDPWQALHPGFALSVAATAGVMWPAQALLRHSDTFQRHSTTSTSRWRRAFMTVSTRLLATLWQTSVVTFWAQLAIIPILILAGIPYAPWGILTNVLVAPVMVPLCVGAAIATLIAPFAPALAGLIVTLLEPACDWVFAVAQMAAQLPGAQIHLQTHDLLLVCSFGAAYAAYRRWRVHKREVLMSDLSDGQTPADTIQGRRGHGTATERSTDPH